MEMEVEAYNRIIDGWEPSPLEIELTGFRDDWTVETGGLGRAGHFWRIVDMFWNYEGSPTRFERTPWAERMVDEYLENNYLSVAGSASSGKSGTFAVMGIVEFLSSPINTKVLLTSTSKGASKNRIWGSVTQYWNALPDGLGVGKLVDYLCKIRLIEDGKIYDKFGLELIACEPKKEKDAIGKLIGFKAERLILIADELPELTEAVLNAALSNLSFNPYFRMVGLGNPKSYFDAFGIFSKPKDGWESISQESESWETLYGKCLRLDGEKSPNVLAGKTVYKFGMPTLETIEEKRRTLGVNSPEYWRMVRGFWSPTGAEDTIYSEADIFAYGGAEKVTWQSPPLKLAGLDPNFTYGGDAAMARVGYIGTTTKGLLVLQVEPCVELRVDMRVKGPHGEQLAQKFKAFCEEHGVVAYNTAVDSTGGGASFCDILAMLWSDMVLQVGFGGAATDRIVSETDPVPAKIRYENRVTQLWYAGVDLLRNGQLRGIEKETTAELTARKYSTRKAPPHPKDTLGIQYCVEPKKAMKARIGSSPDRADCLCVLIELACDRHGLMPGIAVENRTAKSNVRWNDFVLGQDVVGRSADFLYT